MFDSDSAALFARDNHALSKVEGSAEQFVGQVFEKLIGEKV